MKFNVVFILSLIGCVFAANYLNKGSSLQLGSELQSQNGQYRAVVHLDGNFVVYNENNTVLWASYKIADVTPDEGALNLDYDGNLQIYVKRNEDATRQYLWSLHRENAQYLFM